MIIWFGITKTYLNFGLNMYVGSIWAYYGFMVYFGFQTQRILEQLHLQIRTRIINQNHIIKLNQITIYKEYFQLKLFQMVQVDFRFLFSTILFMLNYSVLISQTKQ